MPPIPFEVMAEKGAGIEVVCTGEGLSRVAISGVSLELLDPAAPTAPDRIDRGWRGLLRRT